LPGIQKQPAAIETGGTVYVAFAESSTESGPFAIQLRSFDGTLTAGETAACPISETSDAAATSYSNPAIAFTTQGTSTTMLVGWQDANGSVYVRSYTPNTSGGCGTTGTQTVLSSTNASQIALAGIPSGFLATWKSGSDVLIQGLGASGGAAGHPQQIDATGHTASNPSVASIPSGQDVETTNIGAFAVVWADLASNAASNATTIYAQRFKSDGTGIEGVGAQISVSSNGGEVNPVITGSPTATGSYVVTWVDNASGPSPSQVRARYMYATAGLLDSPTTGQSPYIQNPFDGTTGEFPVGLASGRVRVTPTVAVGGGNMSAASYSLQPYVAFGWVDNTSGAGAGIIARRFPSPQQFQQ
jgi:hypothetical protein